jgi:hypothetical protein
MEIKKRINEMIKCNFNAGTITKKELETLLTDLDNPKEVEKFIDNHHWCSFEEIQKLLKNTRSVALELFWFKYKEEKTK